MKYESSITYHSKTMANVKVFANKQTNKWTNGQRDKRTGHKLYAADLSMLGHKNPGKIGRYRFFHVHEVGYAADLIHNWR